MSTQKNVIVSTDYEQKIKKIADSDPSAKIATLGVDCGKREEDTATFEKADCEVVLPDGVGHPNNSYIVFGRDRPGSKHVGYGGKGATQCGMIDIVVGRMAPLPVKSFKYPSSDKPGKVFVDPLFTPYKPLSHGLKRGDVPVTFATDSARIYISQKTDIDENFNLTGKKSVGKSGVGIKADAVRIIGNESIKLVTNPDGVNSYGKEIAKQAGIYLCAHNKTNLQPLVKGQNLRTCIEDLIKETNEVLGTVIGICDAIMLGNSIWGSHIHDHPPPANIAPIIPAHQAMYDGSAMVNNMVNMQSIESLKAHQSNFNKLSNKYLKPTGGSYINSYYNKTN